MSSDAPAPADPVVEVDGLRVRLGGESVLDGVDADVARGRFVGLVGPNGAGKTTLLRTVAGAITPDAGRVVVDGDSVHDLPSKAASRRVATVPQNPTLAFDFDVRTVVEMGRNPHRSRVGGWRDADAAAVDRALDRTDTRRFADRGVTTLSGGERQRVLLARALAQAASVLLLDEPTASLDINHQVRTLELVSDLVSEGRTAIAAIHDLDLAARYCDEVLVLSDGDIVAAGPPPSVLTGSVVGDAFHTRAVAADHPVTGAVSITALPGGDAHGRRHGEAGPAGRVHVVGGDAAVRCLYALDAAGFDVSVGAANEGSSVVAAARTLGIDAVTVPPFAGVDADARAAVERRVEAADCVVVADVAVGPGNLPNLRAARGGDRIVVAESEPFAERNHAGPAADRVYEQLRTRADVVTPEAVERAVAAAVDREPGPGSTSLAGARRRNRGGNLDS